MGKGDGKTGALPGSAFCLDRSSIQIYDPFDQSQAQAVSLHMAAGIALVEFFENVFLDLSSASSLRQMESLYGDILRKKQELEAEKTAYEKARQEKNLADTRYSLGMMSQTDYLSAEMAAIQAKADYRSADLALVQAMDTYEWAVLGIA